MYPGTIVRLKYSDPIQITDVTTTNGVVTVTATSAIPEGSDNAKVGTIHWVSHADAKPVEIRSYERLFTIDVVPKDLSQLDKYIAPNTKVVT